MVSELSRSEGVALVLHCLSMAEEAYGENFPHAARLRQTPEDRQAIAILANTLLEAILLNETTISVK
jgi:hypothetical protein